MKEIIKIPAKTPLALALFNNFEAQKQLEDVFKELYNNALKMVEDSVDTLLTVCTKCFKTGSNNYGECECSYETSKFITKKQVINNINKLKL